MELVKENFQLQLDKILEDIKRAGIRPTLLLHSCCGPCSSYVISYLAQYFNITVFFYNPNIFPEAEYQLRLSEQKRLIEELKKEDVSVDLTAAAYDHDEFLSFVKGFESEKEGAGRCSLCFELRLRKTYDMALREGFDYFCSTLSVSPHKNALVLNKIGRSVNESMWLVSDFKKRDGYKKSIELSKKYELYRQEYCGCEFAMNTHQHFASLFFIKRSYNLGSSK